MALPAKRRESSTEATGYRDADGELLDSHSLLAALEREHDLEESIDDVPRGIVFGVGLGLALWVVIIGSYFLLARL